MIHFDYETIKDLLKDFYKLTGMKTCIYDNDGNEICYYPQKYTEFCEELRKDAKQDELCKKSELLAIAECKKTHNLSTTICHAGLLECYSPIIVNDNIIGYIAIGQIRQKGHDFQSCEHCKNEFLQEKFHKLHEIDEDKIKSAIHILDACTGYKYLTSMLEINQNHLGNEIEKYINKNLAQKLTANLLCAKFRVSKNELYDIFKEYFNASVAEFIKKRRLEKACDYLVNTNLSVWKICTLCGIPDYNYFSKVFKKQYDVSPTEFKRLHTKQNVSSV